jgi:DNA-binding NarL/FixJ family response regulator
MRQNPEPTRPPAWAVPHPTTQQSGPTPVGGGPVSARPQNPVPPAPRPRRNPGRPGGSRLTPDQLAIAALVRQGLTNSEIGKLRFISKHTVNYHLRVMFRALDVRNRTQLVAALAGQLED